ncbi:MAG: hypothetical protein AB1705_00180 [Verrucomicrobiota bacterium]
MRQRPKFHTILLGALAALTPEAGAQVRSLTLGIQVNSPYGISEPWVGLREELVKFPGIEWVSERPATQAETCEVRPRGGRLLDASQLDEFIRNTGAGASLRGMEATVDGTLKKRDGKAVIRLAGTEEVLALAALTQKVQYDFGNKKPHAPTQEERAAYDTLLARWGGEPRAVRITGPLTKAADQTLTLQVRQFESRAEQNDFKRKNTPGATAPRSGSHAQGGGESKGAPTQSKQ